MAKGKFDKHCDFCGALLENRKGIQKFFQIRDYGEPDNPKPKRVCEDCDKKFSNIYGVKK